MIRAGKPFVYDMTLAWTAFPWTGRNGTNPCHQGIVPLKTTWDLWAVVSHAASLQFFPTFWISLDRSSFGELACFAASRFLQISYLGRARNGSWRFVGNVIVAQQGLAGFEHSWCLGVLQSMAVASYFQSKDVSKVSPLNQSQSFLECDLHFII